MNSSAFLRADGTMTPARRGWWSGWLPTLSQIQQAIQLRALSSPDTAPDTVPDTVPNPWALSMRQGMGLVIVAALLAGFIPFLFNTVTALQVGAPLPFVELAQQTQSAEGAPPSELERAFGTLAGLQPALLPGWLAALLSTIGEWINWPLRWLAWWLVYGTATLLAAKVWGAPTTLQWFLAATSYAAVPMILVGLSPIPCLGFIAQIVAVAWMAAVYVTSVRAVTGLDYLRAAVAIVLPAVVISVLGFVVLLAAASTVVGMIFSG